MTRFALTLAAACGLVAGLPPAAALAKNQCSLTNGPIKHIVYLQFDNTHFIRDNVNVPSDLEQMPALLSFLQQNGTLSANNHTQLISHTANGILSSITGVYPDRIGSAISNSFAAYKPDGTLIFPSDFVYWTNPVQTADTSATADHAPTLIAETGKNAPAPWVAYTRAGCDFGAVALADMELENTTSDIINVFGAGSPQAQEAQSNPSQAAADFEGIAIHCAKGSALCATANGGSPDPLPDEPKGYKGFNALFGHKMVVPAIASGASQLTDLLGNPIKGFPSFDGMYPAVTLAYAASMLEAGVPVVYGYLSDAHDHHIGDGTYGPGEAGYVQQLADYNAGFAAFFARLKKDGIDQTNTLFIITVEEGDHFVGGKPTPANCDGVNIACAYSQIGEIDAFMNSLIVTQTGNTTPFDVHFDMAPAVYIHNNPDPEDPVVRKFEQDTAKLAVTDPLLNRSVPLTVAELDRNEMKLLHMITADPLRTPTFVPFAYPDFFVETTSKSLDCNQSPNPCVFEGTGFAWNHGGIQTQIATTWLGLVGPGVQKLGVDKASWTDHTDIRPTILALAGLKDDYTHDGRVLAEYLDPAVLPASVKSNLAAYVNLASAYKQLNAPFGTTAQASIVFSTAGLTTTDPTAHANYLSKITQFTSDRDALATKIRAIFENTMFGSASFSASQAASLTSQANALTQQMQSMAAAGP